MLIAAVVGRTKFLRVGMQTGCAPPPHLFFPLFSFCFLLRAAGFFFARDLEGLGEGGGIYII